MFIASTTKPTLRPTELIDFLVTYMPSGRPIVVTGPPGVGKSDCVHQAARLAFGRDCTIAPIRGSQMDGCIVRGLPAMIPAVEGEPLSAQKARFAQLDIWPDKGPGVIFYDELDKSDIEVQNALLEPLLERTLGGKKGYRVPHDISQVAAANRITDRAGSNRFTTALKSRCIWVELAVSHTDWLAWATNSEIHPLVTAFIELKGPDALYSFDPAKDTDSFPAPRTWHMLSDCLKFAQSDNLLYPLTAGSIGDCATAHDFVAFAKWFWKLPRKEEVVANPLGMGVPQEQSMRWAMAVALVDWTKGSDGKALDALIAYALRLSAELTTFFMVHLLAKVKTAFKIPAVVKWATANSHILARRRVNAS